MTVSEEERDTAWMKEDRRGARSRNGSGSSSDSSEWEPTGPGSPTNTGLLNVVIYITCESTYSEYECVRKQSVLTSKCVREDLMEDTQTPKRQTSVFFRPIKFISRFD